MSDRDPTARARTGPSRRSRIRLQRFVREKLRLQAVPSLPEITLYQAHAGSGLRLSAGSAPPYWAYVWAGGAALARHFLDHPNLVAGRSVLDLGAGSGLVGIAAAKAGANRIMAVESDPTGQAALMVNAEANGVTIEIVSLGGGACNRPVPELVAAGDVFYSAEVATWATGQLERVHGAGATVLVGDPGRAFLPWDRLQALAAYPVSDFGSGSRLQTSQVFAWQPEAASPPLPDRVEQDDARREGDQDRKGIIAHAENGPVTPLQQADQDEAGEQDAKE